MHVGTFCGSPMRDKLLTLLDEPKDHIVLLLSFHRNEIHAVLPANVSSV